MDENILQVVKNAAISMLRGHEPDIDVYTEEVIRTDRTLEPENEDSSKWYFVKVTPIPFTTTSPDQAEATPMVPVDYREPKEPIHRHGGKAMELDRVLRPVFPFIYGGEKRAATVVRVTISISGGTFHLIFPFTFIVSDRAEEGTEIGILEMRSEGR